MLSNSPFRLDHQKCVEDPETFKTYQHVMDLRQQMILAAFQHLLAEGVAADEFAPVDCHAAATLLEDATACFVTRS